MRAILIAAAIAGGLALPRTAAVQPHPAWLGEWALNVEQSVSAPGGPVYGRGTLTIEPWDDGVRLTYEMVGVRGGVTHLEWTGTLDGTDYPVQGVEEFITFAYRRLDDRAYEVISKVDLAVMATSTMTLSVDGNTITTATTGKNAQGDEVTTTAVYEKR